MNEKIKLTLKGFLIGITETMPGVSGGTMALILGIYKQLISTISDFDLQAMEYLVKLEKNKFLQKINFSFILPLVLGMVLGVYLFSFVILFLLENYPHILKACFSGLMLGSLVFGAIKPKSGDNNFFAGFLLSLAIIFLYGTSSIELNNPSYLYIFFTGFIAVCALILPGISGSFILLLLGTYALIIKAVNDLNMLILSTFILGCVVGLVTFVRVVRSMYEKNENALIGFFSGLVLLSIPLLWKVDPWVFILPISDIGIYLGFFLGLLSMLVLKKLNF